MPEAATLTVSFRGPNHDGNSVRVGVSPRLGRHSVFLAVLFFFAVSSSVTTVRILGIYIGNYLKE